MTKPRQDGLLLLSLGIVTFLLGGIALEVELANSMIDFKLLYYSARTLLQHGNPYDAGQVLGLYRAESVKPTTDIVQTLVISHPIYLPTAFTFIIPFAALPWELAQILWITLIAGSLAVSAYLMWKVAALKAPVVAGALLALLLVNCILLLFLGNAAGIAVSFCVIAAFSFISRKFEYVGVLCLAISLMLKPHDSGLVWLYFLISGGVYRKRAMQVLVVAFALSLPAVLWVTHVAPSWIHDLRANLSADSPLARFNDPAKESLQQASSNMVIDLEAALSTFSSDPQVYRVGAYVVCGTMLVLWLISTVRLRGSMEWFALASVVPITMLVTYHRPYDATLLMLAVPAVASLWITGGTVARAGATLTVLGIILTGTIPLAALSKMADHVHLGSGTLGTCLSLLVFKHPAPLILLVLSIFYLWILVKMAKDRLPLQDAPMD